jgi:hypothetical protein
MTPLLQQAAKCSTALSLALCFLTGLTSWENFGNNTSAASAFGVIDQRILCLRTATAMRMYPSDRGGD